jgi:hypothetical protein
MNKKKKTILTITSIAIILLLAFVVTFFKGLDEKYLHIFNNDEAACMGCFSHIGMALRTYAMEYEDHFPAGKEPPLESLNIIFGNGEQDVFAANMASHDKRAEFLKYYQEHRKIPEHLSCYRYNEGLTESAPQDSILMYYYKPIKWAFRGRPTNEAGRAVMAIDGSVRFYPEAEFQKLQKATLSYLSERKARGKDLAKIASILQLRLHYYSTEKRKYILTAELVNNGFEEITVKFLSHGSLAGVCMLEPYQKTPTITLKPKEKFQFPMGNTISTNYSIKNEKIRRVYVAHKGLASSGDKDNLQSRFKTFF